ncbi:DoxX family protein [Burkholderia stagnalis]|nr:DoxX family protein [Burkholderia stagnalis]KVN27278.1 DoxX family protein [Burkholderia stagnalis]KVN59142.1 DoxX family protein [Burkholderia stagnalis]KWE06982.1 DoxX family protein [Burkholderia stagnalis]KWE11696.1 DoxX family protein [Burkholderia stagnalis]
MRPLVQSRFVRWLGLLGLCSAYLQGGLHKAGDFGAAIAEMQHFGVEPAAPVAALVIAVELVAPLLILTGVLRWLGAGALAGFTLFAASVANAFWHAPPDARFGLTAAFLEHVGLACAFALVALHDLHERSVPTPPDTGSR